MQLIIDHKVDCSVLTASKSNLLHILFSVFESAGNLIEAACLAKELIKRGVNPNLVDDEGKTPLHVAVKKYQTEAIKFAISFNLDQTNLATFNFN